MSHHHRHPHDPHDAPEEMAFEEKMAKLLDHWIKHNDDHAESYEDWAQKAEAHHLDAVAARLREVADSTREITVKFQNARAGIKR